MLDIRHWQFRPVKSHSTLLVMKDLGVGTAADEEVGMVARRTHQVMREAVEREEADLAVAETAVQMAEGDAVAEAMVVVD